MTEKMRIFVKGILQGLGCPSAPLGATRNKESAVLPVDNQADHGCNARLLIGYLAGRRITAHRTTQERVPVAFLYNGVRLAKLPVVEGKPEVFFTRHTAFGITKYYAHFTSELYYATSSDGVYCIGRLAGDVYYSAKERDTEWTYGTTWENDGVMAAVDDVLWANFNVVDENGDVVLPKSDPIPVYE